MATYNGAKYIKEQIDSILSQLNECDELIISDDGSTDDTLKIIAQYNDPRIHVINHSRKARYKYPYECVTANIESALQMATGEYIFLSDQDDVWLPEKVEKVCAKLAAGHTVVLHNGSFVDSDLHPLQEKSIFEFYNAGSGFVKNLLRNTYLGAAMAFSRRALDAALPIPRRLSHDMWIGIVAEHFGKACFLDEKLMFYRRHGGNVSPLSKKDNPHNWKFKLTYRCNLLWNYLKFKLKRKK